MNRLGCRETSPGTLEFGLLLPWVSAANGNRLFVKIIHEQDQFLQDVPPLRFEMSHADDAVYGDFWSATVAVDSRSPSLNPRSAWGQPGRYVYRYELTSPEGSTIDWINDPFAREFGVGKLAAITVGYRAYRWSRAETAWRTPALEDLVIYELMLNEFAGGVEGTIDMLGYLSDLGVNCIEVMPVHNVTQTVNWGFLPLGYFGVDERFGKRRDFQRLVDAAHQQGIAVVMDAVYGHTDGDFGFGYTYRRLGYRENPFMGSFAKDYFGESTDFRRKLTQDFFFSVNHHWLDAYHVDGFRYDCVPNYWDGPLGVGYANLVYSTYQYVKDKQRSGGHWRRFADGTRLNIIQCAEQLETPLEVVNASYSNCTWQNETFGTATAVAQGRTDQLTQLGFRLGLAGYPRELTYNGGDTIAKSALQYVENHDHARFICNFGTLTGDNELLWEGNRERWYKVQPYLIALLTGCGIPMLWQGEEICESYYVPDAGRGRVSYFRPVRWELFYDDVGQHMISLVRCLTRLRRDGTQFRRGSHYFYNDYDRYQSRGVVLFSRAEGAALSLVALNFGDEGQQVPFTFERSGHYREGLHGLDNLDGVVAGREMQLYVPGNYGRVWTATG